MEDKILETRNLTKEFKGFTAVQEVNLQVQRGAIHALIGPNGAGKTTVFPNLTPLENVRLALQRATGTSYHFWKSDRILRKLDGRAMELLEWVGLVDLADEITGELAYGRKRALEIATTLALDPELMLLDEPTQGMGAEDVEKITSLIRTVSANRTILMVEHNLKVVSTLADRITVLQRGSILAEGTYDEVSQNPQVLEAYMGSAHA